MKIKLENKTNILIDYIEKDPVVIYQCDICGEIEITKEIELRPIPYTNTTHKTYTVRCNRCGCVRSSESEYHYKCSNNTNYYHYEVGSTAV